MLPTLENSEKFKTEFNNFRDRISAITNDSVKSELSGKLTELLREVRAIDSQHKDIFAKKELPSMVPDTRSKIVEVRKYLAKRLEDWDRSQSK